MMPGKKAAARPAPITATAIHVTAIRRAPFRGSWCQATLSPRFRNRSIIRLAYAWLTTPETGQDRPPTTPPGPDRWPNRRGFVTESQHHLPPPWYRSAEQ